MPESKNSALARKDYNRRREDRVFRLEGWVIAALIGITGCLGNYTLHNMNDNYHDTAEQVKQINEKLNDMNMRILFLSSNLDGVTKRIDQDEKTRNQRGGN